MKSEFLLLITLFLDAVHGAFEVFITPSANTSCLAHPCITLNEYARDIEEYLMDNSTIIFLPGNHRLDIVLHLQKVSNLTLTAIDENRHSNVEVLCGPLAYIKCTASNTVEINSIIFVPNGVAGEGDDCSILLYFQETSVFLSNLTIIGNNKMQSTATCFIVSSQVTIHLMTIGGVTSFSGATINAVNSTVDFVSHSTFCSNTAINRGGTGTFENCIINVIGSILFANNRAFEYGGAVVLIDSIFNIFGNISFINNSAVICGGAVMLNNSDFNIYGNASFIKNIVSIQNESSSSNFVGGGAMYCTNSRIYVRGYTLFEINIATAPVDDDINSIPAQGGAIFAHYSSRVIFDSLSNTIFIENNSSHYGGAISIIADSELIIQRGANSSFQNNSAVIGGGGAIYEEGNSNISCYGVSESIIFEYNEGFKGGAIYADSSRVTLVEIMFIHNFAYYGGALDILRQSFAYISSSNYINNFVSIAGGAVIIKFQSVVILEGNNFFGSKAFMGGALMVWSNSNVTFCGENTFLCNNASYGGAIYALDSFLTMRDIQNFMMNTAHKGGAMTLSGSTKLILSDVLLNFIKNSAMDVGGAIYFEDINSIISQYIYDFYQLECFLELTSLYNIKINFSHNSAGKSGSILYGGGLDTCQLSIGGMRDKCGNNIGGYYVNNPFGFLKNNISYIESDTNETSEFSSKPYKVCICDNKKIPLSETCSTQTEAKMITGMEISIYVATVGQYEQIVPSTIQISFNNDILVRAKQHVQKTTEECTLLQYQLFSNIIMKNATLALQLEDASYTVSQISIEVYFSPCPSGFILDESADSMKCVCDKRLQQYTTDCKIVSLQSNYIERKSNTFWMGALYDNQTYEGLILHPGCPFDYCVDTPVSITLDDLDVQCKNNHSGILCGSCKDDYSIALGTLHCIPCSNSYISLVVPFAFAGLALIAFLLLLNLSVSNGMINGLIFYANIIQANRSVFFSSKEHNDILSVFIAWMNLDLGIETCFYDGMTIYAFTWLQFLFPFYVWFLIALIIVLSRFSDRVANSLGSNPVATLATLLLVSYSKILRSVIAVFTVARLEYPDNTYKHVWLYDGSVPYFKRSDHIVLGAFAVMVSVFLFLPYTLLLFCGHWLQAFSNRWMFSWLNKIKPFMDAYYAPYKKHTRFWIGLLLIIRCIIFLVSALNTLGNNKLTLLIIISTAAFLATLAWVYNRIYEKLYNDILEAFFILNLCILAAGTYHIESSATGGNQAVLTYTSVGIAFVTFICILIYHIYLRLLINISALKVISDNIQGLCNIWRKNTDVEKQESMGPTTSSVKLLESLLDSK